MNESFDRRTFLGTAAAAGVAAGVHTGVARADDANGANKKIVVGVMGAACPSSHSTANSRRAFTPIRASPRALSR